MEKSHPFRSFPVPTAFARQYLICCSGMGEDALSGFLRASSYSDSCLLIHVAEGALVVEQYGRTYRVLPGTSVILCLHDPCRYYFQKGISSRIIWFSFSGQPALSLMGSAREQSLLPLFLHGPGTGEAVEKVFEIDRRNRADRETEMSAHIYGILMAALAEPLPRLNAACAGTPGFQKATEQFIRSNIDQKFTLDMLADQAEMSRSKYCALFRESFGMTPFQYIRELKIETAKQLLRCTDDSICEISSYLQFHDQSYFTNAFRQVTGITPGLYRSRSRNGELPEEEILAQRESV